MPFIPNTPESLLARSDSKNPATTCRGTTSSGRPCRRSIAAPRRTSASSDGVLTEDLFCWQHKDQAAAIEDHVTAQASGSGKRMETLRERTSIDTMTERLGLLDVSSEQGNRRRKKASRPQKTERIEGGGWSEKQEVRPQPPRQKAKRPVKLFCCFGFPDVEDARPRPVRPPTHQPPPCNRPHQRQQQPSRSSRPALGGRQNPIHLDPPLPTTSQTQRLLSLIPKSLTPQTTSLLLAELSKPISESDEEGYIYIFWLTPESLPVTPAEETARGLLDVPRPDTGRRTSEVLRSFSIHEKGRPGGRVFSDKILLKIGRANNVQRRMNEWKRQCGYNLSLIRYYPYQPSSPAHSPAASPRRGSAPPSPPVPRKVPHASRVERLIHIELAEFRAKESGKCEACGREHREWFEVEARREKIKEVDSVVKRWVDWSLWEYGGA